jgi:hypothetical protein
MPRLDRRGFPRKLRSRDPDKSFRHSARAASIDQALPPLPHFTPTAFRLLARRWQRAPIASRTSRGCTFNFLATPAIIFLPDYGRCDGPVRELGLSVNKSPAIHPGAVVLLQVVKAGQLTIISSPKSCCLSVPFTASKTNPVFGKSVLQTNPVADCPDVAFTRGIYGGPLPKQYRRGFGL